MNFKRGVRALGVLAILFHCAVILTVPNRESFITQALGPIVLPYANLISMNMAWQFFSPDPGIPIYMTAQIQKNSEDIAEEQLPPEKDEYFFRTFYDRRTFSLRFAAKNPAGIQELVIPWLCRKYPEATSVVVSKTIASIPSLDSVRAGKKLNELLKSPSMDFVRGTCTEELVE